MANELLPRPNQARNNVVWLDINSQLGVSSKPDLLPGPYAINNSLFNLFRCPIGARGPIFQPEYGTLLMHLLQEPLDYQTAQKIWVYLIQAIQRWEPRIRLDMANTSVTPNLDLPGFVVQVSYLVLATNEVGIGNFLLET